MCEVIAQVQKGLRLLEIERLLHVNSLSPVDYTLVQSS